jgi:hypothetical protein
MYFSNLNKLNLNLPFLLFDEILLNNQVEENFLNKM